MEEDIRFVFDIVFVVAVGLAMGSFVTALMYRMPLGLPFSHDKNGRAVRSICPPCGRTLGPLELIPLFSWLFQKGQCQCGKTQIHWRYPALELAVLAYTVAVYSQNGLNLLDIPRYAAIPFVVTLFLLAIMRKSWPASAEFIMIACGAGMIAAGCFSGVSFSMGGIVLVLGGVVLWLLRHWNGPNDKKSVIKQCVMISALLAIIFL